MSAASGFCAWEPGLSSTIPAPLLPLVTLYRPDHSIVDYRGAIELSDFCGLKPAELVAFRVERLIIHDLLVRVTSDLSVPDGPNYEDLGISLRGMVHTIYSNSVLPEIDTFKSAFEDTRKDCRSKIEQECQEHLFASVTDAANSQSVSWWSRFFIHKPVAKPIADKTPRELVALETWEQRCELENDSLTVACLQAVKRVVSSVVSRHGRMVNQPELIATLATNMAMNQVGADVVHRMMQPVFEQAVVREGYRWLPAQVQPVVMNVKGASASGKSTIRPQQRELACKLGIPWDDFALISPDYWRKYLLDYDSLGDDYKYVAMLTGQELEIIDKKLDRYMAEKSRRKQMPHLLIDRFRFDSFSVEAGKSQDSKLLSRFGDQIFLFFMITPPSETVVRAWERGKTTGRYKAVDDLLYHNVEAYTGMPELFLSWVLSSDKKVTFEFLDNSVAKGELPDTAAFGCNHAMVILDLDCLANIDRYRQVNIDATHADEVLPRQGKVEVTSSFVGRCISSLKEVTVADQSTAEIYAYFNEGKLVWWDDTLLASTPGAAVIKQYIEGVSHEPDQRNKPDGRVIADHQHALGKWGDNLSQY